MRCFSPVLVNQLGKEGLTSRATDDRTPDARELRMGRVTVRSPGIIFYLEVIFSCQDMCCSCCSSKSLLLGALRMIWLMQLLGGTVGLEVWRAPYGPIQGATAQGFRSLVTPFVPFFKFKSFLKLKLVDLARYFQKYGELHMGPYCSPGMMSFCTPSQSPPRCLWRKDRVNQQVKVSWPPLVLLRIAVEIFPIMDSYLRTVVRFSAETSTLK
jgi:hypothetical protein